MATQVHPDKRIDVLEKRIAEKDRQLAQVMKSLAELSRRLASVQAATQANSTSISRLR